MLSSCQDPVGAIGGDLTLAAWLGQLQDSSSTNLDLCRKPNLQWAPGTAETAGTAAPRQVSRSVSVTCAVSDRRSAKILNERGLSATPCRIGEDAPP
jgi:hypothetical protein